MKIEDLEHEIRDAMAKIFIKFGMKDVDANILAEIIREGREMHANEIADRLKYSISGVTSSLHRLMRMHLIVRTKRGRRYLYRSDSGLLCTLLHIIEDVRTHEIPNLLEKIDRRLRMGDDEGIRNLRDKIVAAERYLSMVAGLLRDYSGGDLYEDSPHIR